MKGTIPACTAEETRAVHPAHQRSCGAGTMREDPGSAWEIVFAFKAALAQEEKR